MLTWTSLFGLPELTTIGMGYLDIKKGIKFTTWFWVVNPYHTINVGNSNTMYTFASHWLSEKKDSAVLWGYNTRNYVFRPGSNESVIHYKSYRVYYKPKALGADLCGLGLKFPRFTYKSNVGILWFLRLLFQQLR